MIGASSYDFSPYRSNRNGLSPLKEAISENDGSTVTTPIEKLNSIPSLYFSATAPTSIAMARAGTGLNHALTSGKQKHSDLDNLMGEFNDLMSHLKVSVSPCRTAKKIPLTAHFDPNEAETILERSHEFLHQTRMDNSGTHYTNFHTDRTDTDYSSADDSASVATIRELSAQQLTASSAAETGAIQSRITTQMMNMYSKNNRTESSPSTTKYELPPSQQNVPFSSYLSETSGSLERLTDYGPKITDSPLNSSCHQAQSGMFRTGDSNHLDWRYDANDAERVRLKRDDDNIVTASITHEAELKGLDEMIGKIDWEKRNAVFPHYFNALHEGEMRRRNEQQEMEKILPSETRERGRERSSDRGMNNNYSESNHQPNKLISSPPMCNKMPSSYPSANGLAHGNFNVQRSSGDVEERKDKNRNYNNTVNTGYTGCTPYTVSSRSLIHGDFRDSLEEEQGLESFNGSPQPREDPAVNPSNMAVINNQIPHTFDDRMTHNGQQCYYEKYENNDHDFDQSSNRHSVISQNNRQHRYDQHNDNERENEKQQQQQHQEHSSEQQRSLERYSDQSRRQNEVEEEKLLKEMVRDGNRRIEYDMRLRQEYDNHYVAEEQRGVTHVHGHDYAHISGEVDAPSSSSSSQRRSQTEGMTVLSSDRHYNDDASYHRQCYGEVQLQQLSASPSSPPSPSSSTTTTSSSSSPSSSSSSSTQYPILKSYGQPSSSVYDNPSLVVRSSKKALSMPFMTHTFGPLTNSSYNNNNNNNSSYNNNNNNNNNNSHQMADMNYWIAKINKEKETIEGNKRNGNRSENGYSAYNNFEITKDKVTHETHLQGAVEVDYEDYEVKKKASRGNDRYVRYADKGEDIGGGSDNDDDDEEEVEEEEEEGSNMTPPAPPSPLYTEDVNRMQVR